MPRGSLSPTSGYLFKQYSYRPHAQILIPARPMKRVKLTSHTRHAAFKPQLDMLHSPSGFPFRISRGIIGCGLWVESSLFRLFIVRLILSPPPCPRGNLLNPASGDILHSYGRTWRISIPIFFRDLPSSFMSKHTSLLLRFTLVR